MSTVGGSGSIELTAINTGRLQGPTEKNNCGIEGYTGSKATDVTLYKALFGPATSRAEAEKALKDLKSKRTQDAYDNLTKLADNLPSGARAFLGGLATSIAVGVVIGTVVATSVTLPPVALGILITCAVASAVGGTAMALNAEGEYSDLIDQARKVPIEKKLNVGNESNATVKASQTEKRKTEGISNTNESKDLKEVQEKMAEKAAAAKERKEAIGVTSTDEIDLSETPIDKLLSSDKEEATAAKERKEAIGVTSTDEVDLSDTSIGKLLSGDEEVDRN
jgi:hypothetical protein